MTDSAAWAKVSEAIEILRKSLNGDELSTRPVLGHHPRLGQTVDKLES